MSSTSHAFLVSNATVLVLSEACCNGAVYVVSCRIRGFAALVTVLCNDVENGYASFHL